MHPGLHRHAAIRNFNASYFYPQSIPDSPLASLAYISPVSKTPETPIHADYTKLVIDSMLNLPWFQTYGLSYEQTMLLPYNEWRMMLDALQKKVQDTPDTSKDLAVMNKQVMELLIRMVKAQKLSGNK